MAQRRRRPDRASSPTAFEREAEALRALAHPKRLMIVSRLGERSESVTDLAEALRLSLPNASQHLRVLRDCGIVRSERIGQVVRYRLSNPAIRNCCALVRQLVVDEAARRGEELRSTAPEPIPPRLEALPA